MPMKRINKKGGNSYYACHERENHSSKDIHWSRVRVHKLGCNSKLTIGGTIIIANLQPAHNVAVMMFYVIYKIIDSYST